MKTIRKKITYFTKILLVIGLLFSDLSSLSVIFADGETENFTVSVNDNNNILIDYLQEIEDTDVVKVTVNEYYTYLNGTAEQSNIINNVTGNELSANTGFEINSPVLANTKFDGLYEASVSLYNITTEENLGTLNVSKNIEYESGMRVTVLDELNNVINKNANETYEISETNNQVTIIGKLLSGGLSPTDVLIYQETEYTAMELLDLNFSNVIDFTGRLYGEYSTNVSVLLTDANNEEVEYNDTLNLQYGTYDINTNNLNLEVTNQNLDASYKFEGNTKNGILNVYLTDRLNTMLDLYNILSNVIGVSDEITYTISNSEYEDVMTYDGVLSDILVDDSTQITLKDRDLAITYKAQVLGDINKDNQLNQDDLEEIINQKLEINEPDLEKSDIYDKDGEITTKDVVYLNELISTGNINEVIIENEKNFSKRLEVSTLEITSGDTFTVDYITTLKDYAVNGFSGTIDYDKNKLELISVEKSEHIAIGTNNQEKFLYFSNASLLGNYVEQLDDNNNIIGSYEDKDYILLTITFRALNAGNTQISIKDIEYIDTNIIYSDTLVSTDIIINESNDNSLSSLTIAGMNIELEDNVLEYKITVDNSVTVAQILATLNNPAATITSIVSPEELVEGDNEITIIVTAENGDEKIYTIIVTREASKEETNEDYYVSTITYEENNTNNNNESTNIKKDDDKKEEPVKEKESTVSRVIIITLILASIGGLIYLIFKDDDEETKKANKEINKLKHEDEKKQNKER